MGLLLIVIKIIIVAFFLVMFLRGNKLIWGIGLLTVTSAILLDTLMSTFGRDEMLEELGFFFFIVGGILFAGAAIWLWAVLRPAVTSTETATPSAQPPIVTSKVEPVWSEPSELSANSEDTATDRQMLYDQIRYRMGPEDILDLIFDLGINENDVISYHEEITQLIVQVINIAEQRGQTGDLALAVERILTPVPAEHLPRLEKLSADSPQTVLRHFLLANYNLKELEQISDALAVDWETIAGSNKGSQVRNLLLYLYRRNRIDELIQLLQQTTPDQVNS